MLTYDWYLDQRAAYIQQLRCPFLEKKFLHYFYLKKIQLGVFNDIFEVLACNCENSLVSIRAIYILRGISKCVTITSTWCMSCTR